MRLILDVYGIIIIYNYRFSFFFGRIVCYILIATIIIDSPCDYTEDLDQSHTKEYIIASTYIDLWLKWFCSFNTRGPSKSLTFLQTIFITRDSEVIMFSPCVFLFVYLCVCLCLSRCLSGRFNYKGLVPHKQYFAAQNIGNANGYLSGIFNFR